MSVEAKLIDLWADIEDDEMFARLRSEGARLVPGCGAYRPKVMLVTDSPGAVETAQGKPFSGAIAYVLGQLMDLAGLRAESESDNTWMTYAVKYRLTPLASMQDIARARVYLRREWKILGSPPVIVTVGSLPWSIMGRPELGGINRNAGQMIPLNQTVSLWPMFHPKYGMANESEQPRLERNWENLGLWLREEGIV